MDKNEIKKKLYREKPLATFQKIRGGNAYYSCKLGDIVINFEIPVIDMGDADFLYKMEANLLNRWILI